MTADNVLPPPERSVRRRDLPCGMVKLEVILSPDEAALVLTALNRAREVTQDQAQDQADDVSAETSCKDPKLPSRAEGTVALAESYLAGNTGTGHAATDLSISAMMCSYERVELQKVKQRASPTARVKADARDKRGTMVQELGGARSELGSGQEMAWFHALTGALWHMRRARLARAMITERQPRAGNTRCEQSLERSNASCPARRSVR
jgi:hypothetical protein